METISEIVTHPFSLQPLWSKNICIAHFTRFHMMEPTGWQVRQLNRLQHPPVPTYIIALTRRAFCVLVLTGRGGATVMNFKSCLHPKKTRGENPRLPPPLFILALGLNFPRRRIELESDNWHKVWKI